MTAAQAKTIADMVFEQTSEWKEIEKQILEASIKGHCAVTVNTTAWPPGYSKRIQYHLKDKGFTCGSHGVSEFQIGWNVELK